MKTQEEIYLDLKKVAEDEEQNVSAKNKRLTAEGRKYFLFPQLKLAGFDTFEKVVVEYEKIANKQSTCSKSIRESIVTLCQYILQEFDNQKVEEGKPKRKYTKKKTSGMES
jgi:hypothetical protein